MTFVFLLLLFRLGPPCFQPSESFRFEVWYLSLFGPNWYEDSRFLTYGDAVRQGHLIGDITPWCVTGAKDDH